jgi:hypothetical protein
MNLAQLPQSADPERLRVVVDAAGGVAWEVCVDGVCLQDRSRERLKRRVQENNQAHPDPGPSASQRGLKLR